MAGFVQVVGRKVIALDQADLRARIGQAAGTVIDLGTGEGRFILSAARDRPERLHIGVDAAADNMAKASRVAAARKTRLDNVLFLRGAAENLPDCLAGVADQLTIHYPWGSLMGIVAAPVVEHLARIRACCKPGAELSVLLNHSVFEDRDYLERLGFGGLADPADNPDLPGAYERGGFVGLDRSLIDGDPSVRTVWGRHLVRGSARRTLVIDAVAG